MSEESSGKLIKKAKTLRHYMIFYVTCMLILQIFAYLKVNTFWMVLVGLLTSIPSWNIYIKYGILGLLTAMFSLHGYDVYVDGVRSDSKKSELQGILGQYQLLIMVALTVAGVATTGILILFTSVTILIQAIYNLKKDKDLGKQILRSLGISWTIPVVAFILLTIWINII